MSDSDVRNAIRVLKRHGFTADDLLKEFPELLRHSELACPLPAHGADRGEYTGRVTLADHNRYQMEAAGRWRVYCKTMPTLRLGDYNVKLLPPFGGQLVRAYINELSIYFDSEGVAGLCKDYWEVYPVEGDCARFDMHDVEGLKECIDGHGTPPS